MKNQKNHLNREAWLTEVAEAIAPLFPCQLKGKPYRVTCGWPSVQGLSQRSQRVGECHSLEASKGKVHELFISPVLDSPLEVAGTLAHELAHVAAGVKAAHGKDFVAVCKHVGLTQGKPRSVMPGDLLNARLQQIIDSLPPYSHQAIVPQLRKVSASSKVVSMVCTDPACGCKITIATKWLEAVANPPVCGCGQTFQLRKK